MQKKMLFAGAAVLALLAVIFAAGCVGETADTDKPTVELVEISAGQQINSLALDQIDGMINWQPNVAAATVSGIGKVISYSEDLPRADGKTWDDHTCCVFGANTDGLENTDLATVLTGLMLLGNKYINDYPDKSAELAADWIYGSSNPTYGDITVSGVDILKESLPTIKFSTEITPEWLASNMEFLQIQRDLGTIKYNLLSTNEEETKALIYDFAPYDAAKQIIDSKGSFPVPSSKDISIGYLQTDHDSPLFTVIKDWKYFKDNYGIYLKPVTEKTGPVEKAELYVNDNKICTVNLIAGSGGPNLMTLLQTNGIQYAVAGTPPFLNSIDTQPGLKIISPIMTEGSAFLVAADAPANNWDEFVAWAIQSSEDGENLLIAIPQVNSIQDVQMRAALDSAGIAYKMKSA
ncbi:MAG TPA: hypothetical protein O0X42_02325 [Methanocorpusculum sp.]|nr:hypothetical protein [Methanocorpusculum sp.]